MEIVAAFLWTIGGYIILGPGGALAGFAIWLIIYLYASAH